MPPHTHVSMLQRALEPVADPPASNVTGQATLLTKTAHGPGLLILQTVCHAAEQALCMGPGTGLAAHLRILRYMQCCTACIPHHMQERCMGPCMGAPARLCCGATRTVPRLRTT